MDSGHDRATVVSNGKGTVKTVTTDRTPMNRPRETEKALDAHIAQWVVRLWTAFGAVYALFIGVSILLGGENRFAAPAYQIALRVPGAPWTWGVIILTSGI